jgi:hypothetical protein
MPITNSDIAKLKGLDINHAQVTWYENDVSDGWECPKCHKPEYMLDKEPCTPDWTHNIADAWGLVEEAIQAGLDFNLDHELNREWSDIDDYYDCWKCFLTRWEDAPNRITFATWNNAIDKENETWDKTHTAPQAICEAYAKWKESK